MSVESFRPGQDTVRVTANAVSHFRSQLQAQPDALGVRLSVRESGCTGYMYVVDLVEDAALVADDTVLDLADDVRLYIDQTHVSILTGTEVDFVREGVNRQLSFNNPQAKDHCGCGESFNVETA